MPLDKIKSLPLELQLQELEHTYAECLMDADPAVLATLWNQIKDVRVQLGIPIYLPPKD